MPKAPDSGRLPSLAIIGSKGFPFVYSGYETLVRELATRLSGRYEVHVYCHRALFEERPKRLDGVFLHYVPALETKYLTHLTHALTATVHAACRGYDVYLYLNACHGPFGYLLKLLGRRSAINTDGLEWRRPQLHPLARAYYRWAARQCKGAFDVLVADAAAMADIYREEFGAKSTVIAYGAEVDSSADRHLLAQWGLEPDDYYFVFGRLIPDNNAMLVVEAFLRSGSRRRLVIAGDLLFRDAYADRLKSLASDRVRFVGMLREPPLARALYRHCFTYVHGHEFGGTNPTLLEALAKGCCVMALDTVFNREVLEQGRYGLLFPKDADALAAAMSDLEASPDQVATFRQRSQARIQSRYTWELVASQYDDLLQGLLQRAPRKTRG
jgi:glycosyltransferase involved in cell wall biosynthesis